MARLHPKETEDPNATSVSMFGAPCRRLLNPPVKKSRLMIITASASSIWVSVSARKLCSRKAGSGHPAIWWPMVIYISTARKPMENSSRFLSFGVSRSFSTSSFSVMEPGFVCPVSPLAAAPYPASSTARITCSAGTSPSTPMELVSRLTDTEHTPGTFATAFSTRAWQAAQLMPVTVYCLISAFPISSVSAARGRTRQSPAHPRRGYPRKRSCGYGRPAVPG